MGTAKKTPAAREKPKAPEPDPELSDFSDIEEEDDLMETLGPLFVSSKGVPVGESLASLSDALTCLASRLEVFLEKSIKPKYLTHGVKGAT